MNITRCARRTIVSVQNRRAVVAFVIITQLWPFAYGVTGATLWAWGVWLAIVAAMLSAQIRIRIDESPLIIVETRLLGVAYRRWRWSRSVDVVGLMGGWGDQPVLCFRQPDAHLELEVDDRHHDAIIEEVRAALARHRRGPPYR